MASEFGDHLRRLRNERGWDQGDLARELGGITQQTVSRWERGGSRPRRHVVVRLAALFGADPADLLAAASYGALADRNDVPLPVRPRATVLPLAALSPERFEEFVADLAKRLYPSANSARFGGQGHTQSGFDVVVQSGGRFVAGFQCKRRRQFGPEEVRAAVDDATAEVDAPFLVLSRVASPDARIEISKHQGWALWDVEDVSREVRALPLDDAVRIIDTYFPGWREPFLGVSESGPWQPADDYFRPVASSRVYTHEWQLVGRAEQLTGVLQFLDGTDLIGCLVGRGGIGKTRLLREVAIKASSRGHDVRFISNGAELRPEHFELLPRQSPLVVIVDDAHERSDIATIVRAIAQRNASARVLLALRPYGLGLLAGDLRHVNLHPSDLPRWDLDDLTSEDAQGLARQALGTASSERLAMRLASLTADCPLITVVAGVLIERGQLDAACLDHEDTVRTEVLRAFRDILVADPLTGDASMRRGVLDALSLLQPFRSDDAAFRSALSHVVGEPYDRALMHLRGLEDAGVVLRRGSVLRIVPDLLGDVVLAEACFDERSGATTGYIERAIEAVAEPGPLQNIFVNASRVDWQIRHDHADAPSLTDALWHQVESEFDAAGILGRRSLLELLRRVAHFAPERTLALVGRAVKYPTEVVENLSDLESTFLRLHPPTYNDVLHEVPPLLRGVGYHLNHLPEALIILWDLARRDDRPTNQHPQHALRVLQDAAKLEIGKPLAFNHAVVDAVSRWLARGQGASNLHSPFDVLEPMLATEGSEDLARGYTLVFKPFVLTPASVAPVRQRIIDLAFDALASPDLRTAARAPDTIGHALRYPHGLFGREIDASERDEWTPEFVATLHRLEKFVRNVEVDPAVLIAVRKAIRWHAEYSTTGTREAAQRVLKAMPMREEDELAIALFDGWGQLTEGRRQDYEQARVEREERSHALASRLVSSETDGSIVLMLEQRLSAQAALGHTSGNSGPFVWALTSIRPEIAVAIASRILSDPESPLLEVLAVSLAAMAEQGQNETMATFEALLGSGDLKMRREVAHALGWNRGNRTTLLDGELNVLNELAVDPDVYTRKCIVRAAQRLGAHHREVAVSLLGSVPFADSTAVANEVLQTFGPHSDLGWQDLPPLALDRLLGELTQCPSIEDYWIIAFLSDLSGEHPHDVVRLLQARVQLWGRLDGTTEYQPLPFNWDHDLRVRETNAFPAILLQIRDWLAAEPDSWRRLDAGAELFSAVALTFDEPVQAILEEAAATMDAARLVAVAAILRQAPRTFVFENVDFVRKLLDLAARVGDEHVQRIGGAFSASAVSGVRMGVAGQPFAEDIDQKDRARAIADTLPSGSAEQRLYRSLQTSAEQSIKWNEERDELMDGRQW